MPLTSKPFDDGPGSTGKAWHSEGHQQEMDEYNWKWRSNEFSGVVMCNSLEEAEDMYRIYVYGGFETGADLDPSDFGVFDAHIAQVIKSTGRHDTGTRWEYDPPLTHVVVWHGCECPDSKWHDAVHKEGWYKSVADVEVNDAEA